MIQRSGGNSRTGKISARWLMLVAFPVLLPGCANPVQPTGGPKDEAPPELTESVPVNFSRNFESDRFELEFNEFITLKNVNKNLLVSPPLTQGPKVKIKGRGIECTIEDTLNPNTTYTFNFNDVIADITEGNTIRNFSYVFSTGDSIDMGGLSGTVHDAFTKEPSGGISVMLYMDDVDSLPLTTKPWYLSRTDEKGHFEFRNISVRDYKLFALKDDNNNMLYDLPTELIGFNDSLLRPYVMVADTDTVSQEVRFIAPLNTTSADIMLFDEEDPDTKIMQAGMSRASLAEIVFNKPGSGRMAQLVNLTDSNWLRPEHAPDGDTLRFWLPDPIPDTLVFVVSENGLILDTVQIYPHRSKVPGMNAKELEFEPNVKSLLPPEMGYMLTTALPVSASRDSSLLIIHKDDTLFPTWHFRDSTLMRRVRIDHDWEEGADYSILILPGWLTSISGLSHDTLRFKVHAAPLSDYGSVVLRVVHTGNDPVIIDLMDKGGKVLRSVTAKPGKGPVNLPPLKPGDYSLRAVIDRNGNGYWDPGSYMQGIQPETVIINPKALSVKANWELDLDWEL